MINIIGKRVDKRGNLISYIVYKDDNIEDVTLSYIYNEYNKGNIDYIDIKDKVIYFRGVEVGLIPTYYKGRSNRAVISIIKILYNENNEQIGAVVLVPSGEIRRLRKADIIELVNKGIKIFNADIINKEIELKWGKGENTENKHTNTESNSVIKEVAKDKKRENSGIVEKYKNKDDIMRIHEINSKYIIIKISIDDNYIIKRNSYLNKEYNYITVTRGRIYNESNRYTERIYTITYKDGHKESYSSSENVSDNIRLLQREIREFIQRYVILEYDGFIPETAIIDYYGNSI